jgi:hypothetical protein
VFERDETQLGTPKPISKVYSDAALLHKKMLREKHGWLWRIFHLLGNRR